MAAFLVPRLPIRNGVGECSIGLTAGNGREGAGDADLRTDGDEPKDDRRLCEINGGFMGSARDVGVPGIDGAGEPGASEPVSGPGCGRRLESGGAGLEMRLPGRSIFVTLLC